MQLYYNRQRSILDGNHFIRLSKYPLFGLIIFLGMVTSGCKKFIEVNSPATSINAANVYSENSTAAAVLTGLYANMSNQDAVLGGGAVAAGFSSLIVYPGLSSDEFKLFDATDTRFSSYYKNDLSKATTGDYLWNGIYTHLYNINAAIEGLSNSTQLSVDVRKQLTGEAFFMRAFSYFYLVNVFGDVPLVLKTDYSLSQRMARTTKDNVWKQIIEDLKRAKDSLSTVYYTATITGTTTDRVRPTKWAASAMLARAYLYNGDFVHAEEEAGFVINSNVFALENLNAAFQKASRETIWALQPVQNGNKSNTGSGALFVLPSNGPSSTNPIYLSNSLINSFESSDMRRTLWVGNVTASGNTYYYANKYKIGAVNTTTQEFTVMLRLSELYLIRAEARAQQNNIIGSQSDLNKIRNRAGLANSIAADATTLLSTILHERQVELFSEWGHRWFDLKRTNTIDMVMSTASPNKGGSWAAFKALYPVPKAEIDVNNSLSQNPGY